MIKLIWVFAQEKHYFTASHAGLYLIPRLLQQNKGQKEKVMLRYIRKNNNCNYRNWATINIIGFNPIVPVNDYQIKVYFEKVCESDYKNIYILYFLIVL